MLNISPVSIESQIDKERYSVFKKLENRSISKSLIRLLIVVSVIGILALFLPWTQNIRSQGYVSSLNPYDKPQSVQSLIDGKIEKWYVQEGDEVKMGDTILYITESKDEYLDPDILIRTEDQINAKVSTSVAYERKAEQLEMQYNALLKNRKVKLEQNVFKINQEAAKLEADSIDLNAAKLKVDNTQKQVVRINELYDKGIKSLTDKETKNFELQTAIAKLSEIENKIRGRNNELENLQMNTESISNDIDQKLAKIQSERLSAESSFYNAKGEINKLQSQFNKYEARSKALYVSSPIDGIITETLKNGIGEYLKAGEKILTIMPIKYDKAVEMYVRPRDMPLLKTNQKVRIQFDGWPSIVFSGWPNNSYGTFGGRIFSIDNIISDNGKYRILVKEDKETEAWPGQVRIGGGADALILLNDVKLYYELWRQLNGFPPDYYDKDGNVKVQKFKAPIKKLK